MSVEAWQGQTEGQEEWRQLEPWSLQWKAPCTPPCPRDARHLPGSAARPRHVPTTAALQAADSQTPSERTMRSGDISCHPISISHGTARPPRVCGWHQAEGCNAQAPGLGKSPPAAQTGAWTDWEQPCRAGLGDAGSWRTGHEPSPCACSPASQPCPGLRPKQRGQRGEGADSPEPSARDRPGAAGAGPEETTETTQGLEPLCCGERLREPGCFSLGKSRLQGDLTAALQYVEGAYKKVGDFLRGAVVTGQGTMVFNWQRAGFD